jgi:hypothetical protein
VSASAALEWRGFHLVHHGDRDRLLRELVRPCAAGLLRDGLIRRFFWIRYDLGGPHVRLRLELDPARAAAVAERVRAEAAAFFQAVPPSAPLDGEVIRRRNRGIAAGDPSEAGTEDVVFPDNSVVEAPVRFETERYGGSALLDHSCDLFTVSSIAALDFLASEGLLPAGERLMHVFRMLVQQGWGHAHDGDAFSRLLGYALKSRAERWMPYMAAGDAAFARQRGLLCSILHAELSALAADGARPDLARGALELADVLGATPAARREDICASHLHMTANRLGLNNREEVYLGRILLQAAGAVAEADPGWWSELWSFRRSLGRAPGSSPSAAVASARARFAAPAALPV